MENTKTDTKTMYGVFFQPVNPAFPVEFCDGYVYNSYDRAHEMACKLNTYGCLGHYIARVIE